MQSALVAMLFCYIDRRQERLTRTAGVDMRKTTQEGVTRLLLDWRSGNEEALEELTPIVYGELRRLAQHYMDNEREHHVLQATALVHEAYIRLIGLEIEWEGRGHFFAVAARLMRRILVDYARKRDADKRGGGELTISLEGVDVAWEPSSDLLALDDALRSLAEFDERKARVVELRFFGGLTIKETAQVVEVGHATVERDLQIAKAWLLKRMSDP